MNEDENNLVRKSYLKKYENDFIEIKSESKKLIEINNYNPIEFFGILLCYLNFYDYKNFTSTINELYMQNHKDIFEILIIYNKHFMNPINQNYDFFNEFINYTLKAKEFPEFIISLKYIQDIETFINIIERYKEQIYEKYIHDKIKFEKYIINMNADLKFRNKKRTEENIEREENNLIIIKHINSIIIFSEKKCKLLIYFPSDFWKYILNYHNNPIQDNILICYELREAFLKYYNLIKKIFCKFIITKHIKDITNYYEIDEFSFLLDQLIRKYINNKNLTNIDKLACITRYNPYYFEQKYSHKVDPDIFDLIDLDNINDENIQYFRSMNFEYIFRDLIHDYISKITSKIKNISNFYVVIQLINIEEIEAKNKFILLDYLNKKYDDIVNIEIKKLENIELNKAIKVIAHLAILNFSYSINWKKYDFIKNKIKKLPKKTIVLIYIELIRIYISKKEKIKFLDENEKNEIDIKELIENIFEEFIRIENEDDINHILNLIDSLEIKIKKEINKKENDIESDENMIDEKRKEKILNNFYNKLFKKNLFTKKEFFSNEKNIKILLLYKLYETGKIKKNEEYYENLVELILNIRKDIEGNITKNELEIFLKNDEIIIIKRLSLIKLVIEYFDPNNEYKKLKLKNQEINSSIEKLKYIRDNIKLYFKNYYKDIISKITDFIKNYQNKRICEFVNYRIKNLLKECMKLERISEKIQKVKYFFLFNIIYEMKLGNDENEHFSRAFDTMEEFGVLIKKNYSIIEIYDKNKEIFDKIQDKFLYYNETMMNKFIDSFRNMFQIDNKNLIDELIILFKIKKYEFDINSILYFLNYFKKDNQKLNEKLFSGQYNNLSTKNFKEIKEILEKLKKEGIYDYKNNESYNKIFNFFYNKREALDYLSSKINQSIDYLKDRIEPSNRKIKVEDILDTEKCIKYMDNMYHMEDHFQILEYLKRMDEKSISQFQNYSKIFPLILELEINYDESENIYEKVNNIIKDEFLVNISDNKVNILYYFKDNYKNITLDELLYLKNKTHINIENEKNNNNKNEIEKDIKEDINELKTRRLLFFKDIITKLEIINNYMKELINKGCCLPIKIEMKLRKDIIEYFLENTKVDFIYIKNFLSKVKNSFKSQLELIYNKKVSLRFLYGNQ